MKRPSALALALGLSVGLHALALSVNFVYPELGRQIVRDMGLEVVLVNARSLSAPQNPQALAQATLDGGGQAERGMATSPLPPSQSNQDGEALQASQRMLSELERQQREMLSQLRQAEQRVQAIAQQVNKPSQALPDLGSADQTLSQLTRQMAIIDSRLEDYQKRPRKHFFAPSTSEAPYAIYVEEWRRRIETLGNRHYPDAARGRLYGSLRMTVYIRHDGHLERVELDQSSGHRVLDEAAKRIVRMGAPYPPLPPEVRNDTDLLVITRTWTFTNDTLEASRR